MNKVTLLKKMKYRRKLWDSLLDRIIENGLDNEKVSEKWYLKDVISHIAWYEKELLEALMNESIVESIFWNMSVSDRNEMIFKNTQEKTLDEVLKESKDIFDNLINKIEDMSDEELNSDDFVKRKTGKRITWDFIGGITFWHFEDHEDALIERFDLDYV